MAKDDYHVIVYYLLSYLYDCLKKGRPVDKSIIRLEAYPEEIDPDYYRYILEHLLKDGLIEGVSIHEVPILGQRNASQLRGLDNMRITPAGIAYLQENSFMKKAYETLKALKDIMPFI
ncbi:YjcQ family protein [Peptococcus simiae]|uniref:YjcQ family protein n=1 Tax=Peptococcus simiae TaxID=1643805 RepID=A0ABW9GXJ5_9FIRM